MESENIQTTSVNQKSRIDLFYDQRLKDSAITTSSSLKKLLEGVENFDWEEFNKPINQIDMQKVVSSIRDLSIGGKWKQKVSKNAKPTKAAIQQFVLDKSYSMGIGCGKSGDLFHIRGLKSRFSTHSFHFGDEVQKQLLTAPIEELEDLRRNMKFDAKEPAKEQDPRLSKKLTQACLEFNLFTEDTLLQEEQSLEQVKYLLLLQHIIAQQVANELLGSPTGKDKTILKVQGSIKSNYDDSKAVDVTKMKLTFDCLPLYPDSQKVTIVSVQDCQLPANDDENVECDEQSAKVKNIQSLLKLVSLKDLDVFVAIESCCTKKTGRELMVMPKFKIVQAVVRDTKQYTKKHVGLKLIR